MAIDRLQTFDSRVVVELAVRFRSRDDLVRADKLAVEDLVRDGAHLRIEDALPRKNIVGGGELALRALERGIVAEIDARPDLDRPRLAVSRYLRERHRGVGHDLVRPRKVIVDV